MTTPSAQTSPIGQSDVEMLVHLADNMGFGRTHDMLRRVIAATPYLTAPAVAALGSQESAETWAYIERLLHDECGLRFDEGLEGQRANIINAIKNGRDVRPDAALLKAAIEFLSKGEGLHKIRVDGKMMARKDVADALAALPSEAIGREWQPIETAPKDGTHILAYRLPIGIRVTNLTNPPTVVHWFDDPEYPDFYTSVNERAPDYPFRPTHWMPLPADPLVTRPHNSSPEDK